MPGAAELLQIMLLALAFICGIPALAYLAFKGNVREPKKEAQTLQPTPTVEEKESGDLQGLAVIDVEGWERFYAKVAVKGYIFIPKPVLKEIIREIEGERRPASQQMKEKPAEPQPFKSETRKLEVRRA